LLTTTLATLANNNARYALLVVLGVLAVKAFDVNTLDAARHSL